MLIQCLLTTPSAHHRCTPYPHPLFNPSSHTHVFSTYSALPHGPEVHLHHFPKMASDHLLGNKSISSIGCGVQCFFSVALAGAEGLILVSMACDHYVAICFPLHYPIHMSKKICVLLITGSWIMGSINSCAHTAYVLHIHYCRARTINHFFCDIAAMLTLACMDTLVYENTVF